jgi:hypothetical protein
VLAFGDVYFETGKNLNHFRHSEGDCAIKLLRGQRKARFSGPGFFIGEHAYLVARPFIDELSGKSHIIFVGQL